MKIPLFKIYNDENDIKAITKVIKYGMSWATGSNVQKFEEELAKYIGTKYALMFNSGTSALHALMIYYGIGSIDNVIVPSFTFIATANTPLFVNTDPVFADIEEETFGLDPEDIEERITTWTYAIIAVHIGGQACKIKELKKIAKKHNLILIEDACEALGTKVDGQKVGTFGDVAVWSFCANKIITTGEGGAITTNSKRMYNKLKLIRSHGRPDTKSYFIQSQSDYTQLGYNWRMSNITASLGRSQLKKINKIIKLRREKAEYISKGISGLDFITIPKCPKKYYHTFQMLICRISKNRDKFLKYLNENMIGAKVYFKPVHLTKFYRDMGHHKGELPITEKISKEVLSLPIYPTMTKKEMDYMIKIIRNYK